MKDEMKQAWDAAEIIEALMELPTAALQVKALERIIVAMAKRGGGLRRALNEMNKISLDGAPMELVVFRSKLAAALDAAQDDGALASAITEAFSKER
jgi:hypothetical protein